MRILYITGGFPYPLTSGFLRHYHFIKRLSQNHQIVLVSKVGAAFKEEHIDGVAPFTERVIPIRNITSSKQNIISRVITRVLTLLGANPAILQMRVEIKNLLKKEHFDLITLSGEYNISAVNGLDTPPIVMDMCDAKSDRIRRRIASVNSLFWKLTLRVKLWEMQRIERRIFRISASILCASDRDQRIVPIKARERSFVVPNGVDTIYWQRQSNTLGRHCTLIFTGAMHFPPNSDAALYLINEILPGVRQKIPDAKLLIVGHSPGEKLIEAGKQPGVTVTGFVDDMRPYLEKATVFVSPLRFGSGIQNKLLEAMAMSLPIVTSSVAGDGVRVDGMEPPFLIADDTDTFVHSTIGLLRQYDANPTPAYHAREYVETHFTWDRNAQRLNEIIQAVK